VRSPSGTSSPCTGSVALATGRLSPVRAASSISSVAARAIRPSADRLQHRRERLDALLRLGFLAQADHRIEQGESREDDSRTDISGDDQGDRGRGQQNDLHEVLVLANERLEARLLLPASEPVRAVSVEPPPRLVGAEPTLIFDAELSGDRGYVGLVPVRSRGDCTFRLLAHVHGLFLQPSEWNARRAAVGTSGYEAAWRRYVCAK
jgi:hypothetical protein